jgi:hypothetical protein
MRLLVSFAFKKRVFRTLLGLPGVSNTWAMAGERPVKRSGAVYMISYPKPSDSGRPGDRHSEQLVIVDP